MSVDEGVDITKVGDRGVLKRIIKEGTGTDVPIAGHKVTLHYTGTLLDGTKFDCSRERGIPFEFILGRGIVSKAFDIACATMKKGEVCVLTCAPEYTNQDNLPRNVPPNSVMQFEIELIDWSIEDLSPDKTKGILRHLIEPGFGHIGPRQGTLVTVELEGRLGPDGKVFDTRTVTFTLGEGSEQNICEGVERALEEFVKDEKSRLIIAPKYAFKAEGNIELGVPPNSTVEYTVKLTNYEDQFFSDHSQSYEQAMMYRERGTNYFKANKIPLAIKMYEKVVSLLDDIVKEPHENRLQSDALLLVAFLNLSLFYLKLTPANYLEAKKCASRVLMRDDMNVKAWFRRGQAMLGLGEPMYALADFQKVLDIEPQNKAAADLIKVCKKICHKQKQKEKQIFANMFDKFAKRDTEVEKNRAKNEVDVIGEKVGEWGAGEGEWTDQQRAREPTEFEKENPNILLLDKEGQFKNM